MISPDMTREEVAALVSTALAREGIEVVLSGGAVVSIYSDNAYESDDLDLIPTGLARNPRKVMLELGFRREGRHFRHDQTCYWVEFPAGPVAVGSAVVTDFAERTTSVGVLRLLSPTDCVMDRLAAYYHWSDAQAFDQAIAVASRQPVDLRAIEVWSEAEGAALKFAEFRRRLRQVG